jgi:hypothetical protein
VEEGRVGQLGAFAADRVMPQQVAGEVFPGRETAALEDGGDRFQEVGVQGVPAPAVL